MSLTRVLLFKFVSMLPSLKFESIFCFQLITPLFKPMEKKLLLLFEKYKESLYKIKSEFLILKEFSANKLFCVGVCHIKLPFLLSNAEISPIELMKITKFSLTTNEIFCCALINGVVDLNFHISLPSLIEKHLKVFE